ncbi:uncharacterized protein MONBRDRAFT_27928 [Monosiga brevicollis MX1]|uniref:Uncharacterized protein n=1 Tax=Monosiga brevicollis TaxID=81824 RepID=A9V6F7_MONBE|nr:uncharacterized protein MONBRDRAFT_27928 [Monosiga brevicollis MX1]EDQ86799.1 predicted protein [Monosiga brevicollis MX1]|eukprot:XP_001748344.1 hypothetical protein [Monosiga brevicollis MX1]
MAAWRASGTVLAMLAVLAARPLTVRADYELMKGEAEGQAPEARYCPFNSDNKVVRFQSLYTPLSLQAAGLPEYQTLRNVGLMVKVAATSGFDLPALSNIRLAYSWIDGFLTASNLLQNYGSDTTFAYMTPTVCNTCANQTRTVDSDELVQGTRVVFDIEFCNLQWDGSSGLLLEFSMDADVAATGSSGPPVPASARIGFKDVTHSSGSVYAQIPLSQASCWNSVPYPWGQPGNCPASPADGAWMTAVKRNIVMDVAFDVGITTATTTTTTPATTSASTTASPPDPSSSSEPGPASTCNPNAGLSTLPRTSPATTTETSLLSACSWLLHFAALGQTNQAASKGKNLCSHTDNDYDTLVAVAIIGWLAFAFVLGYGIYQHVRHQRHQGPVYDNVNFGKMPQPGNVALDPTSTQSDLPLTVSTDFDEAAAGSGKMLHRDRADTSGVDESNI